jgi:hypothetical protein
VNIGHKLCPTELEFSVPANGDFLFYFLVSPILSGHLSVTNLLKKTLFWKHDLIGSDHNEDIINNSF